MFMGTNWATKTNPNHVHPKLRRNDTERTNRGHGRGVDISPLPEIE